VEALSYEFNLADAHTHQFQSFEQREIIQRLPEIWHASERLRQSELEDTLIKAFFELRRQPRALLTPTMLVYAASIAALIVANLVRQRGWSVSLIHPCFDNLHQILRSSGVVTVPLAETSLHNADTLYERLVSTVQTTCLFIVDPNNPTGHTVMPGRRSGRNAFSELLRYAVDYRKVLIFDFCFAPFLIGDERYQVRDVYAELEDAGVTYVAIEDTGKVWPLQDAKVALLKTSRDLNSDVRNILTGYLLNVSPFILSLVAENIRLSQRDDLQSVRTVIEANRRALSTALNDSSLRPIEPMTRVSVAWLQVVDASVTSHDIHRMALEAGVYVLPGRYFFWARHSDGDQYVRVALARDTEVFSRAALRLRQSLVSS